MNSANLMRSLLFVPGSSPERFTKAENCGADIFCIDLEDSVASGDKDQARVAALEFIINRNLHKSGQARPYCFLRINGLTTADGLKDLLALAELADTHTLPDGLVLPMVNSTFEIRQVVNILGRYPGLNIMPLIENPEGLENIRAIVRESDCVSAIGFGFADFAATVGSDMSWDALLSARNGIIAAASTRRIHCFDGPWFEIRDQDGLREEAAKVSRLGFKGKMAIHPSQVPCINETFVPSVKEIAWAREVITVFNESESGVVSINGMMVDKPVIDQAKRILGQLQ
ncbi:CoA ester lyase [Aestuariicella sp. G3-2]|uniref:HpcH/HpaI aldolase/citrate lyase family protein n=1 Tax=Pseudomaricurvus albidus TaxID=2842452 RepID=UPI001C0AF96D|nr:aldolase/citrate lyase family protein [Aestuariicella albida]MBU3071390.1 CoA ester lyase [Aestuariicella albida]